MKKTFAFSIFLLVLLLLLPLFTLKEEIVTLPLNAATQVTDTPSIATKSFKILLSESGKIETLSAQDYLFGVIAGEMPALYEAEALKAQAICAYTFALWRQRENTDKEYDITDDYTRDQCYLTHDATREKWGSKADEYETKIRAAIKDVENLALTYNGEIILSVYHSVSSGKTESAKNVWGKDYPYLQAVSSIGDKLATNYITTATATPEQIETAFSVTLPQGIKGSFSDFSRTASGTVESVKIGGKEFTGSQVREALNLKSANFEVSLKDNLFIFTVYGYGHGVGLSQNGANYMAQQGNDYKQILTHYYTGCKITQQ